MADLMDVAAKYNFQECSARGLSSTECAQEEVAAMEHLFNAASGAAVKASSLGLKAATSFIDSYVAQNAAEVETMRAESKGMARFFGTAIDFIKAQFDNYLESAGAEGIACSQNAFYCGMSQQ